MPAAPLSFDSNPNLEIKTIEKKTQDKPAKKDYTAEEVEEMARATMRGLGWEDSMPKKEPDKKDAQESATAPATDESTAPAASQDEAPKKRPPKKAKEPEPDMADKIAAKIGEENEKLLARITPEKPAPQTPPKDDELDREDRHQLDVFAEMSAMPGVDPQIANKFEKFFKLQKQYQSEWERGNPGKIFDPEAGEHEDWYEANQPAYDPRTYHRAQSDLSAKKIVEERERQMTARQAVQGALLAAESSIATAQEALEEDVKRHLDGIVGENKILESDGPILQKYQEVSERLSDKVTLASVLMTPGTSVPFDTKNPDHLEVQREVLEFDADIAALTDAERRQLISTAMGKKSRLLSRQFVPASEYQNIAPSDRHKFWTICAEPALAAKLMTVKAKTQITGWLDSIFNQVGKRASDKATAELPLSTKTASPTAPSAAALKPNPPSLGTGASNVSPQPAESVKGVNSWEEIAARF